MKCSKYKYDLNDSKSEYVDKYTGVNVIFKGGINIFLQNNCGKIVGNLTVAAIRWKLNGVIYLEEEYTFYLNNNDIVQGIIMYEDSNTGEVSSPQRVEFAVTSGTGKFSDAKKVIIKYNSDKTRDICIC
jgi:hypothetical protein